MTNRRKAFVVSPKGTAQGPDGAEAVPPPGVLNEPRRTDPLQAVRALARATRVLERASGELSLAHYRVLSAIDSGDERASRVANRLAVGKPTVSAAVDALEQRGLLIRSGVDGDQRVVALHLTTEGSALLSRVEAEMIRRIDDLCARTPDGDQLMESLVWLGSAIDDLQAQRVVERRGP